MSDDTIKGHPEKGYGYIKLRSVPFDLVLVKGNWTGKGAEHFHASRKTRLPYPGAEADARMLHWPRRAKITSLEKAVIEIRNAIPELHAPGMSQEVAQMIIQKEWPEDQRQSILKPLMPFAVVAEDGARICGEFYVEIQ